MYFSCLHDPSVVVILSAIRNTVKEGTVDALHKIKKINENRSTAPFILILFARWR
jgi:hypothetical protein